MINIIEEIEKCFNEQKVKLLEQVQELWSGFGMIERYQLPDGQTVIAKHIQFPSEANHPRGWNTSFSNQRKRNSYDVEVNWYARDHQLDSICYYPKALKVEKSKDEILILMEDLLPMGYKPVKGDLSWEQIESCIQWLAYFHVKQMNDIGEGLWETGTYWHLATRPDELEVLEDQTLKHAASKIDTELQNARFQTLVHGDAKIANFCLSNTNDVAAVDFQYIGKGVGVKDLAYFVGSVFYEQDCERHEQRLLNFYFEKIKEAISFYDVNLNFVDLEREWRDLYPVAWADFHRFLKGWSPGHWKINSYSERVTKEVIEKLL